MGLTALDIPTAGTRDPGAQPDYHSLNAMLNLYGADGKLQLSKDRDAAREFFLQHVNRKMQFFHTLDERLDFLLENDYYEPAVIDKYPRQFIRDLTEAAYSHKYRFATFLGAFKFYQSYALKTFDGENYLERFEDRVVMVALTLACGNQDAAHQLMVEMITGRFQPATPTFLNAGRAQRGELVSCYLLRCEDNMESIARNITSALQLSKRGGGVAINLTNLREAGAPIKKIEGQSAGVIPVMKLLEDSFSYANQLGARQGAGAVYLHAHHPDILRFLDTKKENADEKIRIKTLSLGVVVPDITFELARQGEDMYLFSPYDIQRVYGVGFTEISITEKYREMVDDPRIRKSKIPARALLQAIAELTMEAGYPYIMFEDTVNRANPIDGRITMSNLCSEILQVSTPSSFRDDLSYSEVGKDISCNLGSLNIALALDGGDLGRTVEVAVRALSAVSDMSDIRTVPSIERGNKMSHAVGLGQMNLAGFLGRERIHYGSDEAIDFTDMYFCTVLFHALSASNKLAIERHETFDGFEKSRYADGSFFDTYLTRKPEPRTDVVKDIFRRLHVKVPTKADWRRLKESVMEHGIYNQNLQAVPPTGSISYINNSTASIHPIVSKVEIRKEGKLGRVYMAAPLMTDENAEFFRDAYEVGPEKLIATYAAAGQHVDQGLSLTLFFPETATTRDIIKAQGLAWRSGIKTLYYTRLRQTALEGTEIENCVSCQL